MVSAVVVLLISSVGAALGYTGDTYDPTGDNGNRWCYINTSGATICWDAPETYAFDSSWTTAAKPLKDAIIAQVTYMNTTGHRRASTPIMTQTTSTTSATVLFRYAVSDPCGSGALACAWDNRSGKDPEDVAGGNYTIYFRKTGSVLPNGSGGTFTLNWCQLNGGAGSCFDGRNVALHEMGHFIGLNHWAPAGFGPGASITVMQTISRAKGNTGYDETDYGSCDVARLQLIYDLDSWTDLYSQCLTRQKPAFSAFTASNTSIPYHGSETFTVTFKVLDDDTGPNYTKFENNPIDGHAVVLQRSTDGFATYTEYAMTSLGSGKYSYTFSSLSTTASWRTVFHTPASEGLTSATSGSVTVTVGACTIAPCPS